MKPRIPQVLAVLAMATGATLAGAFDSQKSDSGYVYAPTTLGSRNPVPYVSEPIASLASGAQPDEAGHMNAVVQALNQEQSLQGSKITVFPDGENLLLTGVTVTYDQLAKATQIAQSQAGQGKVINTVKTEELRIVATPAMTTAALEANGATESSSAIPGETIQPATPDGQKILPATPQT